MLRHRSMGSKIKYIKIYIRGCKPSDANYNNIHPQPRRGMQKKSLPYPFLHSATSNPYMYIWLLQHSHTRAHPHTPPPHTHTHTHTHTYIHTYIHTHTKRKCNQPLRICITVSAQKSSCDTTHSHCN